MSYAIYLRKSRVDLEAEAHGEGDTLARHRKELLSFAARQQLPITQIYEEIVSGDTIAARPQMQQLLSDVEDSLWDGVLVMEVERLARGDTIDQGIVAQAFKLTQTKIITPLKSYDPNDEFDEEYFEFGLFMSRREYKTINRRLQRGRLASVKEGKWVGNRPPYGYQKAKLSGEKGYILEPDPETSEIVKNIFAWYVTGYTSGDTTIHLGLAAICRKLNESGIKSASGNEWVPASVRDLLRNPVYCGMIRWGWRPQQKSVAKGSSGVKVQRARLSYGNYPIYQGRHTPIISHELFDAAQARMREYPSKPGPKQMPMKNPLSGLCYCALCGRAMVRRPYKDRIAQLICTYQYCPTKGSNIDAVEDAVLESLQATLDGMQLGQDQDQDKNDNAIDTLESGLKSVTRELDQIQKQQRKLYDLLERGIYSEAVFLERSADLGARKAAAEAKITDITESLASARRAECSQLELAPKIQYVLDTYPSCQTAKEKNDLLNTIVQKVEYNKTQGGRYQQSNMQIFVFPKLF